MSSSSRLLIPELTQLKNASRRTAPQHQVDRCEHVALQSSPPVDPGFRRKAVKQICGDVAPHQICRALPGNRPLANEIDRIGNLRVTKANPRRAPELGAQMNTLQVLRPHDNAMPRKLTPKIDVFLPPIEGKIFVERNFMLPDGPGPKRHIAPVGPVTF